MHYGALVRTYSELLLQWLKYHRPFASHRLFYFTPLLTSEWVCGSSSDAKPVFDLVCAECSANPLFSSKTMKKTLFASLCKLFSMYYMFYLYMHARMMHLHSLPVFVSRITNVTRCVCENQCFLLGYKTSSVFSSVFRSDVASYFKAIKWDKLFVVLVRSIIAND